MIPLFENRAVENVDVLTIQESWHNPWQATTYHPLKQYFELVFDDQNKGTRVCFFINKKLALSKWSFTYQMADLCTLHLKVSDQQTLHVHNVYNPCSSRGDDLSEGIIPDLMEAIKIFPNDEHLAIGDFNLHHMVWGGPDISRKDVGASIPLEWMLENGLDQILSPGTITYNERGFKSTIDLVFGSRQIRENMIKCDISQEHDHDSDHMPIFSEWNLQVKEEIEITRL